MGAVTGQGRDGQAGGDQGHGDGYEGPTQPAVHGVSDLREGGTGALVVAAPVSVDGLSR